jgi:hypothetical protein
VRLGGVWDNTGSATEKAKSKLAESMSERRRFFDPRLRLIGVWGLI